MIKNFEKFLDVENTQPMLPDEILEKDTDNMKNLHMIALKKELQTKKSELNEKTQELENRKKYLKCMKIQDLEVFFILF